MFDIGFFELLVIGVVGLFVIGPERLPETIKSVAIWISRVKRSLVDTRQEIEQHIGADDIRREIYNEQVLHNLEKMKDTKDELEKRINQWKDDSLKADTYLDHLPQEDDIHSSHNEEKQSPNSEDQKPLLDDKPSSKIDPPTQSN